MKTLRLPARLGNLERILEFISGSARESSFSEERIREIEVAAEEALVNIFKHGFPAREPGEVEVRCVTEGGDPLMIEFEDTGIPFDLHALPDPDIDLPLSERKIGGLGVFLIRKMVNEVRYRREGDRNILTFLVRKSRGE
jgi:anti-sigma regulatory factor (Ser/Thr protein kinase)